MMFRWVKAAVLVGVCIGVPAFGQDVASGPAAAPAGSNMGVLQPAVMNLQQALDSLRVDKWKASKEVKATTADNIGSIRRDVEGTLPGLVTAADAAPGSLSAMLLLSRNVGALYDVVLRVTVIAESAAPADQADALEKSLSGLEGARRTLADRQQQMAAAQEARLGDLQKQWNARPAVAAACPPVAVPVPEKSASTTAAKRKKKVVKPAAKSPAPSAKPAGSGGS
jgi:hypothetical protein